MIIPNLFIVGAPKCGTTSLHNYLGQHPEIWMSRNKEPHYFDADLEISPEFSIKSLDRYVALFQGAGSAKWVGEASVLYLQSREAARGIKEFSPEARIIVMIRNPVELVDSLHLQWINMGSEDIYDLREAIAAIPDRNSGRRVPPGCRFPRSLDYIDIATLSPQIERYFACFGRDRVHVINLDDLKRQPLAVLRETFRFLQVDEAFVPTLEPKNATRRTTWLDLQVKRWMLKNVRLRGYANRLPPFALRVYRWLASRSGAEVRPTRMPDELKKELNMAFRPEVERLSRLLGRDLSHWSQLSSI